jgi:hypothetical protein
VDGHARGNKRSQSLKVANIAAADKDVHELPQVAGLLAKIKAEAGTGEVKSVYDVP